MTQPGALIRLREARRSTAGTSLQALLALFTVASFFVPARRYPLLFNLSQAQIRIQDVLLAGFIVALLVGPAITRVVIKRASMTLTGVAAAAFGIFATLSLGQVPTSQLGASATALGKLIEFSVAGALAGIVIIFTRRFLPFVGVVGVGVAANTVVSETKVIWSGPWKDVITSRAGIVLGPDILATAGAVAALAGIVLLDSTRSSRRLGIAVTIAGGLAMFAGKSILAAGAFLVGLMTLFLVLRRPALGLAIVTPVALLALVLAVRHSDVTGVVRLFDAAAAARSPAAFAAVPPAVNLVRNGGCEGTAIGWNTNGRKVTVSPAKDQHRFGVGSCNIRTPGASVGEGIFYDDARIQPSTPYSLSGWIRAPPKATLVLGIEWLGTVRQFLTVSQSYFRGSGSWARVFVSANAPPNAVSARPTIYSARRKQAMSYFVDGVLMEQGRVTPYGLGAREPPTNLLVNDGFEANTGAWNTNGAGVRARRVTGGAKLGVAACQVATRGAARGEGIFHNRIAVSPASSYSFTAWIRVPAPASLALRIEWLTARGDVLSVEAQSVSGDGRWKLARLIDATPPARAAWARPTISTVARPQRVTFLVDGAFFGSPIVPPESSYARGSLTHRLLVSYIGARIAADHPLTGVGWLRGSSQQFMAAPMYEREARDLFPAADPALYPSQFPTHSHSAYIQTAADAGIPALLAFILVIVGALGQAVRAGRRLDGDWQRCAGVVAAMIAAIAFWLNSTPLFGGSLEVGLLWCSVGMAAVLSRKVRYQLVRSADT
jgi:hypothetical protein